MALVFKTTLRYRFPFAVAWNSIRYAPLSLLLAEPQATTREQAVTSIQSLIVSEPQQKNNNLLTPFLFSGALLTNTTTNNTNNYNYAILASVVAQLYGAFACVGCRALVPYGCRSIIVDANTSADSENVSSSCLCCLQLVKYNSERRMVKYVNCENGGLHNLYRLTLVKARRRRVVEGIKRAVEMSKVALDDEHAHHERLALELQRAIRERFEALKVALLDYTGPGFWSVNGSLRNSKEDADAEMQRRIDAISSALATLRARGDLVVQEGVTVYRGIEHLPECVVQQLVVGELFSDAAFFSTSLAQGQAFTPVVDDDDDAQTGGFLFRVKTAARRGCGTGVHVELYSAKPYEQEVLFPPGTLFRIVAVLERQPVTGLLVVDMEEVGADQQW